MAAWAASTLRTASSRKDEDSFLFEAFCCDVSDEEEQQEDAAAEVGAASGNSSSTTAITDAVAALDGGSSDASVTALSAPSTDNRLLCITVREARNLVVKDCETASSDP